MMLRCLVLLICVVVPAVSAEAEVRTLASGIIEDVREGNVDKAIMRVQAGLRNGRISAAEARDILQLAVSVNQLLHGAAPVAQSTSVAPAVPVASAQEAAAEINAATALLDGAEPAPKKTTPSARSERQFKTPQPQASAAPVDFIGKVQATKENDDGDTVMVLMDIGSDKGLKVGGRVQIYQNGKKLIQVLLKTVEETDSLGIVLPETLVEGGVPLVLNGDIVKPAVDE